MGGRLRLQRTTRALVPRNFRPRKPAPAWAAPGRVTPPVAC